jgi:hypothetical protein
MEKNMWLVYAVLAGLAWGTYVPFVHQGITGLTTADGKPQALGSFLCVGIAYFLIAVLIPGGMFASGEPMPRWNTYGITMATLAGAAGAAGALCVILANRSAVQAYGPRDAASYRMYIAPVIFALAPVLNAVISSFWHASPEKGAFHFELHLPGWKMWLGIVLAGAGAALVLYSKEEAERQQKSAAAKPVAAATASAAPIDAAIKASKGNLEL